MIDKQNLEKIAQEECAVLVGVARQDQPPHKTEEYLQELAFLAETLGVKTVKSFTQKIDRPDSRTFVKSGKIKEIIDYVKEKNIKIIIFDDDLSAAQTKNIDRLFKEAQWECIIWDRSLLILEIFMYRAQTAQAKTQVELARYQYLLPRLTRMWTHLERQRGGTGTRGGAGEKEIETDRRIIKDKIALLKEKLGKIDKQSATRRKSREQLVRVALVGYTNVGKSTLMRLLSKEDVFAENKLFATVDSTVRKVFWNGFPFLLTDTVGFIRKLPTTLIECFKSTLAEITEADVLLHVVDVSHSAFEEHIKVVNQTLAEIGASDKPTIYIFNKVDMYKNDVIVSEKYLICPPTIEELQASYIGKSAKSVFISAAKKMNIDTLKKMMLDEIRKIHYSIYPNYVPKYQEDVEESLDGQE